MLLRNLIKSIPDSYSKIKVKNLALDSRRVRKGYLFFALPGSKQDGKKFIIDAKSRGACAIIFEGKLQLKNIDIPMFFLNKLDECNTIMGQQQMDCLLFINQCNYYKDKPDKLDGYYKKLKLKTANWISNNNIIKNNFEYNNEINNIINNISK